MLFRSGEVIRLTKTEWRLLHFMWSLYPNDSCDVDYLWREATGSRQGVGTCKSRVKPHFSSINKKLDTLPGFRHRLATLEDTANWKDASLIV